MTGPPRVLPVEPDLTGTLRRAAPLLRPHRWWLIGAGAVGVLATVAELGTPVLAGLAVDAVVDGDRDRLRQIAVAFAVLAVVAFLAERARLLLTAAAGERVLLDLRNRVADALLIQPLRFFDLHPPGQLVARATTDVSAFSEFVRHGLRSLVNVVLLLVVTVVVLFATSWQLALVALVVVPAALPSIRGFHRASTAAYARYAQGEADVTAAVAELVEARETVQSTATRPAALARAGAPDEEMLAANDDALRAENRLAAVEFWQLAAVAAVAAAGGLMADRGVVSAGAIATTALAVRQLFDPLADLGHLYGSALEARVRLARVLDLVDAAPARASASAPSADGGVELHGVHFAYVPERPVLHDVRLRIGPGEHVALVGPTGAGKSTVAKLAAGLLEPDSGEVRGSGGVIFLPQEAHLVAGTLADNLRMVPGAHTDADLHAAIGAAGLGPWLAGLPDGLDTVLDHRGGNLSAGERQLVALARAALADPAVLILDEATADIDPATDALVSAALGRLGAGRTLIVIAHRPATATRYPRVVRIAGGRVTADGPPQEVLAT